MLLVISAFYRQGNIQTPKSFITDMINIKSGRFNVTLDIDAFDFSSVFVALGSFTDGFKDDGMKVPKVVAIKKITNMSYNCTKLKSVVCNNFETQKLSSFQTYENGPSGFYPNSYHIVRRCLNTINILPALPNLVLSHPSLHRTKKLLKDNVTNNPLKAMACGSLQSNAHMSDSNLIDSIQEAQHPFYSTNIRSDICLTRNIPGSFSNLMNTCGGSVGNPRLLNFEIDLLKTQAVCEISFVLVV